MSGEQTAKSQSEAKSTKEPSKGQPPHVNADCEKGKHIDTCAEACKCIHAKQKQQQQQPAKTAKPPSAPPSRPQSAKAPALKQNKPQRPSGSPQRQQSPSKQKKLTKKKSKKLRAGGKSSATSQDDHRGQRHEHCFEEYIEPGGRLGGDFKYENHYCPHVLIGNWREPRTDTLGIINEHSHLKDYCFYKDTRLPEPITMEYLKNRGHHGVAKGKITYPYGRDFYKSDGLSTYQSHYNQYDCCNDKGMHPLLDFERGMVHYNKEPFQKRMEKYDGRAEQDRIDRLNVKRYPDLAELSYLVPNLEVTCPAQYQPPKVDYISEYALQGHWPDHRIYNLPGGRIF